MTHRATVLGMTAATIATIALTANPQAVHAATPTATTTSAAACHAMSTSLYQYNNPNTGGTFLTTNASEATTQQHNGYTASQGAPLYVSMTSQPGLTAIHRLYRQSSKDYVWLADGTEMRHAISRYGYSDQGIKFYASATPTACDVPVYRFQKGGAHQYSVSATTRGTLLKGGWNEGTATWYANTKPAFMFDPLYDDYTPAMGDYKTTTDATRKSADYQIAATPTATWISGPSDNNRLAGVLKKAAALNQVPQITLYGIPGRDCGYYSAGGLSDAAAYKTWIDQVSKIVGTQAAYIIVEPDAISYCGSSAVRAVRGPLLAYVGSTFKANNPNTALYLHAGSGQLSQATALSAVKDAGIQNYRGVAMGVASLGGTDREETWGEQFVQTLAAAGIPNMHYIVDTSRNGISNPANVAGASYGSCNNPNAALGHRPTPFTTAEHDDAWLWVKHPGVSDGQCGIGSPAAGTWDPAYAETLVSNAQRVGSISILPLP